MENRETAARRSALRVAGISAIFALCLVCLVIISHEEGVLAFAHIGTRFAQQDPNGTTGYDGQFVYFIARDGAASTPYLDGPTLRYQRIFYPMLARALALGSPALVPYTLLLVNIAAYSASAGMMAYLLRRSGANGHWALIFTFWVGCLFALRFGLTELLCFALALGAVPAYTQQRYRWTLFLLILSTLTKELGLVIAAGIAFHAFFNGRRHWGILIFAAPLLAFLAWWGVMWAWFGTLPTRYPAGRFSPIPLYGLFTEESPLEFLMLLIWLAVPCVVVLLLALRSLWKSRSVSLGTALGLAGAGFVLIMPAVSWQDPVAAYRVGMSLVIGGVLFVGERHPRQLKWLAVLWMPSLLVAALIPGLWF